MKKDTRPTPTFTMQMPLELREPLAEMAEKRHLSLGMLIQIVLEKFIKHGGKV